MVGHHAKSSNCKSNGYSRQKSATTKTESETEVNISIDLERDLKIIGKEFQKNCYKTIFRKINTKEIF